MSRGAGVGCSQTVHFHNRRREHIERGAQFPALAVVAARGLSTAFVAFIVLRHQESAGPVRPPDPARVQGLVPRPPAARAAYEGLLHRLKLLIVLLLMKVLKLAAARITRQLAQ